MVLIFKLDAEAGKLPCGCPMWGTKVFAGTKQIENVVQVEAFHRPHSRDLYFRIKRHDTTEDGKPRISTDGNSILFAEVELQDVELRCRHHPDYGG